MRINNSYFFTLREDAKDEESRSGNLLVRSGMTKKVGAGIYMYFIDFPDRLCDICKFFQESSEFYFDFHVLQSDHVSSLDRTGISGSGNHRSCSWCRCYKYSFLRNT